MDSLYDQNLWPRIIMTIMAAAIAIGPMFADFTKPMPLTRCGRRTRAFMWSGRC